MNRFLEWNNESGDLIAESGVLIADIVETFLPRGWCLHVTPGTKFVTLGGAIACDVHGKNHHKDGSFRNFIEWFELIDSKGEIKKCSKNENSELYEWTIGGMGLTGIIIKAAIKLRRIETCWIKQKMMVVQIKRVEV